MVVAALYYCVFLSNLSRSDICNEGMIESCICIVCRWDGRIDDECNSNPFHRCCILAKESCTICDCFESLHS